jgi:hypothetical protein
MTTERRIPAGHVTTLSHWPERLACDTIIAVPGVSLPNRPMSLGEAGMESGMTRMLFVTHVAHFPLHSYYLGGK